MPTLTDVAERLAVLYGQLRAGREVSEGALDALFDAVAELDTLAGGITANVVRRLLDDDQP